MSVQERQPDIHIGWDMLHNDVRLPLLNRLQGMYVLGKNGTGKSSLLTHLIAQDMRAGHGIGVLDPHGDLIVDVLATLPKDRKDDVILLDLQDVEFPFAFNVFACAHPDNPLDVAQTAELVTAVFKRVWGEGIGPRSQDLLENTVYTMIANPGATLDDVPRFFSDQATRRRMVRRVQNDVVRSFWQEEFDQLKPANQQQITAPLLNKVRAFLRHPVLRNIVRQPTAPDFDEILLKRKILLVRLDQQLEEASSLLGTLITRRLLQAAFARATLSQRSPFFLYADEFQRFATPDFGTLLQEARKFGIGTVLAHQLRSQLDRELRSFVLGAGTIICFQLTSEDAREMIREIGEIPEWTPPEFPNGAFRWLLELEHQSPEATEAIATTYTVAEEMDSVFDEPTLYTNFPKLVTRREFWNTYNDAVRTLIGAKLVGDFSVRLRAWYCEGGLKLQENPEAYEQYHRIDDKLAQLKSATRKALSLVLNTRDRTLDTLPVLCAVLRLDQGQGKKTVYIKIEHTVRRVDQGAVRLALKYSADIPLMIGRLTNQEYIDLLLKVSYVCESSRRMYATPRSRPELTSPPEPNRMKPPPEVIFYDDPDEDVPRLPWQ
jgi:hypothetical protein